MLALVASSPLWKPLVSHCELKSWLMLGASLQHRSHDCIRCLGANRRDSCLSFGLTSWRSFIFMVSGLHTLPPQQLYEA